MSGPVLGTSLVAGRYVAHKDELKSTDPIDEQRRTHRDIPEAYFSSPASRATPQCSGLT